MYISTKIIAISRKEIINDAFFARKNLCETAMEIDCVRDIRFEVSIRAGLVYQILVKKSDSQGSGSLANSPRLFRRISRIITWRVLTWLMGIMVSMVRIGTDT